LQHSTYLYIQAPEIRRVLSLHGAETQTTQATSLTSQAAGAVLSNTHLTSSSNTLTHTDGPAGKSDDRGAGPNSQKSSDEFGVDDDIDDMGTNSKSDGVEVEEELNLDKGSREDSSSESEDDLSWDNGEDLTDKERAAIMRMDKFSRAQVMSQRRRRRLEAEDTTSWDNGEPLTAEERKKMMTLSLYERVREMNIRRNKRMELELLNDVRSKFGELPAAKSQPTSSRGPRKPRPAHDRIPTSERRSKRNK
jgi:Ni/Co efflux regulator RcnB